MKKHRLDGVLLHFVVLILAAVFAHGQQITVEPEAGKQSVFQRADMEALPHIKITTTSATYEGVDLKAVLQKAGVEFGEVLRGKRLANCLVVEAADRYRVVFALPEIDPAFVEKQVVLAFLKDGKPMDDKEGPFRIVIPGEKRMARWVR